MDKLHIFVYFNLWYFWERFSDKNLSRVHFSLPLTNYAKNQPKNNPAKEIRVAKILQEIIRTRGMRCSNLSDYSFSLECHLNARFSLKWLWYWYWNSPAKRRFQVWRIWIWMWNLKEIWNYKEWLLLTFELLRQSLWYNSISKAHM